MPYEERLDEINLETLCERRRQSDVILMFKIIHELCDSEFHSVELKHYARGNPYNLAVLKCKTSKMQKFFFNRTIPQWNCLSSDIVCDTLKSFKSHIKNRRSAS